MRKYPAGALALTAAAIAAGIVASGGGTAPSADCSRAAALRVGKPFFRDPVSGSDPIAQVLCGPFVGAGSEAMAVSFTAPTCWGVQRWAIFRFTQGDWRLALDRIAFIFPLVVLGADIRETTPAFRAGDARCFPSGGKRARIWHWSGTRFTAGPWRQVTPGAAPTPVGAAASGYFRTPSGNIQCHGRGTSPAFVHCGIKSGFKPPPPLRGPGCSRNDRISLEATGRPRLGGSVCPGEDGGDSGPYAPDSVSRVLGYGRTWSGGGLRCSSAITGLTCRNKSGHGFFLSRASWRAF